MARTADEEFLEAVEATTWPGERFGHREHVRLAWLYLRGHGWEEGTRRIRETIRRYATALGAPGKYHETLTRAWCACVQGALEETPGLEAFDAFVEAHAELLDGRLLERHYRKETLGTAAAKEGWVEPDLEPLPGGAR